MIVDLKQFIERERSTWEELDKTLTRIENETLLHLTLEEVQRLHYLYERTGAGFDQDLYFRCRTQPGSFS